MRSTTRRVSSWERSSSISFKPPARVDEMVKAGPGDLLLLDEVEDGGDVGRILPVHGETNPHLDARVTADSDAFQCGVESSLHAPKPVMGLSHAVQTHADIGEADLSVNGGRFFRDQCPVRGDDDPHPVLRGMPGEFGEVFSHQRFPAGEKDHGGTEASQVFDQRFSFLRGQFILVSNVSGAGVTVDTLEVAAPRHVPYDHRPLVLRELKEMRGELPRFAPVTQNIGGFHGPAV